MSVIARLALMLALGSGWLQAAAAQEVGYGSAGDSRGTDAVVEGPRIFAAASLAEVLPELTARWEAQGGGPPRVSLDASSRLVGQIARGAPADLLITADREWIDQAASTERLGEPVRIATNRLVLIASSDAGLPERGGAGSAVDPRLVLRSPGGPLALAGSNVPAGRYARAALASLGVELDSLPRRLATGGSVRTALEWVARGEAELGVVYRTDAAGESRVRVLHAFPAAVHGPIEYWAASIDGRGDAFLRWLATPEAASIFRSASFGAAVAPDADVQAGAAEAPQYRGPALGPALFLSIMVALAAVLLGSVPAIAVGRLLARRSFRGRSIAGAILLSPLVVPPVVTGFLLLEFFGSSGPAGRLLGLVGVNIPFTPLAAVLAAGAVGLPLYAVVVRHAFETVDPRYEELSWTLGVAPRSTLRRVVLPLALPGIVAGATLAFARALGEFGATIVLAGNVEGETRTLALAVYTLLETPGAGSRIWFFVGCSVVLSLLALIVYERLLTRQRERMEDGRV